MGRLYKLILGCYLLLLSALAEGRVMSQMVIMYLVDGNIDKMNIRRCG